MTKEIKHRVVFKAPPEKNLRGVDGFEEAHRVYRRARKDQPESWRSRPVLYGGYFYLDGFNLAVEKPGLIVQAWRSKRLAEGNLVDRGFPNSRRAPAWRNADSQVQPDRSSSQRLPREKSRLAHALLGAA